MLDQFKVHATIPASDLARARSWYEEKLGLTPTAEDPGGLWYECAGSAFALFPTEYAGTAKNTAMEWSVTGIESVMDELRGRGIEFEEYDMPGVTFEKGLATMGPYKGCWFKDSEGNILALTEVTEGK